MINGKGGGLGEGGGLGDGAGAGGFGSGEPTMTGGGVAGGSGSRKRENITGSIGGGVAGGSGSRKKTNSAGAIGRGIGGMIVGVGVTAPAVPLIDALPIVKGVVIPPPWLIVIAPSPAPPALKILVPGVPGKPLVSTRNRFPALIIIAPPLPLVEELTIRSVVIDPRGALRVIAPPLTELLRVNKPPSLKFPLFAVA